MRPLRNILYDLFHNFEKFPDGSRITYGHRDSLLYRDGEKFLNFDLGLDLDGHEFISVLDQERWNDGDGPPLTPEEMDDVLKKLLIYSEKRGHGYRIRRGP